MAGGTQKSIRKVLGSLKDTTTVSLAKVNSDYKVLPLLWSCLDGSFGHDASDLHSWVLNLAGTGYCHCQGNKSC